MKLFGSPGSPYVRKVLVAQYEKNIACEFILDRPSDPQTRVPQYNPLGKVPVVLLDDGQSLYDSSVIVEYFDGLGSGARLIPDSFVERIKVRQGEALGDGIVDATVALTHDSRYTKDTDPHSTWYQKQLLKINRGLAELESLIKKNSFCYYNQFSLADICAGMALAYLDRAYPVLNWRHQYPGLHTYSNLLFLRPSFIKAYPKET